jgi:hypothetical protein
MLPSPTTSPAAAPDPALAKAVALLFSTFNRVFGAQPRWTEMARDPRTMAVWERAFQLANLTPDQIRHGLARASLLEWAPSPGQFVGLCRPPSPTDADALAEAGSWARADGAQHEWSHPAVGAAARQVGPWYLRNLPHRELVRLWAKTYADMLGRHARGEALEVPVTLALEHDAKPSRTPESDARSRQIIAELRERMQRMPADDPRGEGSAA